ncbi:hypothetical protein PQD17_gp49 [Pantoea phage PdC23]|uniref:Uncharacterized protein n=1 Tax=Pantoea phage PdC23 TaxID=2894356 RepID=A0AAE8YJ04_9CAUD|nr:hypothetical protein PQD17_gp49 [Pantoea phage PdC23]UGC97762.1 hypothetical protein pdc_049 [Pantoea phage PdC23]
MKKLLIAAMLMMPVAAMAENKVLICDATLVAGLGEQPTANLGSIPQGAVIADNGSQFQVVQGDTVLTSPVMSLARKGIEKGISRDGAVFIKRNGTYQISADGSQWLYYDNCKPAGKGV